MKFLTSLALLLLCQVSHAQSVPQLTDCGANVRQVTDIIRSKFEEVFDADYALKFIGNWGSFSVTADGPFEALGRQFMVYPQNDRTFYGYETSDPTLHAVITLVTDTQMVMSQCDGGFLCRAIEGDYTKRP